MGVRKIIRLAGGFFAGLLGALLVFAAFSVTSVNRSMEPRQRVSALMREHLATVAVTRAAGTTGFSIGYAKRNITPAMPVSMAGSGLRKLRSEGVADSLYVRTMVVSNGADTVAIVSLDMLLVPPALTAKLKADLSSIGFSWEKTYVGATHTHSGLGNWGEHLAGYLYSGPYNDDLVAGISASMVETIQEATAGMLSSVLREGKIPAPALVYNRLSREGRVDSLLRVIEATREDSSKLVLATFTGHATCDDGDSKFISRDYPGVFVDVLERSGYDFAMFMAGAVGSHGCKGPDDGSDKVKFVGERLAAVLLAHQSELRPIIDSSLAVARVPLPLPEPQFRIAKDLRVRPWLFNAVFGRYEMSINALQIGRVVLLGTPCDFSGELGLDLDAYAASRSESIMVTSFNGAYMGYVTVDERYDDDHYETRLMNWYGPGNGAYVTESLKTLFERIVAKP